MIPPKLSWRTGCISQIDRRPTCLPGLAHKVIAYCRYRVGGNERGKAGALRALSGGVSVCGMDIGVGCVHLPKLSESVTMHQFEHDRICDSVESHTETPQLLPTRQKCDLTINGEVRNSKFNVGHPSLQFVDATPRQSIRRVVHRITKLLDVVACVKLLTIYGVSRSLRPRQKIYKWNAYPGYWDYWKFKLIGLSNPPSPPPAPPSPSCSPATDYPAASATTDRPPRPQGAGNPFHTAD